MFEWDIKKAEVNRAKHGFDFEAVEQFEFETATYEFEQVNGEERTIATGFIGDRICVLVFSERDENIRIISLRKATKLERKNYENG